MDSLKRGVYESMQKLSLGIVWRELQVFSKLLYKGRNQHRRDKSFQRLLRVSKDLKKYQAISLSNHVKRVWKILPGSGSLSAVVMQSVNDLSNRLVQCAQFTAKLLQFIEVTSIDVNTRLCMNLFIPFNLLMVASLSRLWYCLRCHLHAISEAFSVLHTHIPANQKLSTAETILSCLPVECKHYLTAASVLSSSTSNLGTAVVRVEPTPSLNVQPQQQIDRPTASKSTTKDLPQPIDRQDSEQIGKSQCKITQSKAVIVKRRRKTPNTVVCAIRIGRQFVSVRIKCRRYLQTLRRQTCFRVKLVNVRWSGLHHRSLSSLSYRVKIKPLSIPRAISTQIDVLSRNIRSQASRVERTKNQTVHRQIAKPCDDIDDIFSALDL